MPDTLQTNLGNFNKNQVSHPRDDPSDCGSTKDGSLLITARNSSCVCHSFCSMVLTGVSASGDGGVPLGLGMYAPGHILWKHNTGPWTQRSTSRRSASYWNAFLLTDAMPCLVYDGMVLENLQVQFYLFNLRKVNVNVKTLLK